jgi:hypothetical protein
MVRCFLPTPGGAKSDLDSSIIFDGVDSAKVQLIIEWK